MFYTRFIDECYITKVSEQTKLRIGCTEQETKEAKAEKVEQPSAKAKPTEKKETLLTRKAFISGFTGFLQRCRPDLMSVPQPSLPSAPKSLSEFVDAASSRPPMPPPQDPPSGSQSLSGLLLGPSQPMKASVEPPAEMKKQGSFAEIALGRPPSTSAAADSSSQTPKQPTPAGALPGPPAPKTAMLPAGAIPVAKVP